MIENIPNKSLRIDVFRLAGERKVSQLIEALGVDPKSVPRTREFLRPYHAGHSLNELCDAQFKPRPRLYKHGHPKSRFSNGSFPVFYTSLESQTADAEIKHWVPIILGKTKNPRTIFYRRIRCKFNGLVKDLRSKQGDWPNLTHDSSYCFCNRLGTEARESNIDAFLTPSVRKRNGTNLPIFKRDAINDPELIEWVSVTYDPQDDCITIDSL